MEGMYESCPVENCPFFIQLENLSHIDKKSDVLSNMGLEWKCLACLSLSCGVSIEFNAFGNYSDPLTFSKFVRLQPYSKID
jgi:hypothetical protein